MSQFQVLGIHHCLIQNRLTAITNNPITQKNSTPVSGKRLVSLLGEQPSAGDSGTQVVSILWLHSPVESISHWLDPLCPHSRWGKRENMEVRPPDGTHYFVHILLARNKSKGYTKQQGRIGNIVYLCAQGRRKQIWKITSQHPLQSVPKKKIWAWGIYILCGGNKQLKTSIINYKLHCLYKVINNTVAAGYGGKGRENAEHNKKERSLFTMAVGGWGDVEDRSLEKRRQKNGRAIIAGFVFTNNGTTLEKVMVNQKLKSWRNGG